MFFSKLLTAVFINFGRLFPFVPLFIHYMIVAVWLGELDCEEIPENTFLSYWIILVRVISDMSLIAVRWLLLSLGEWHFIGQ
jgi:hypothetical protein